MRQLNMKKSKQIFGPISLENWKAYLNKSKLISTSEYPLYSNAHITGELTENFGPYKIFNTIPIDTKNLEIPSLVLRLDYYLDNYNTSINMEKTDTSKFHGGDLIDEIAALTSLCFGIRLMAGGVTRQFGGKDPKGRPVSYGLFSKRPVTFSETKKNLILPQKLGTFKVFSNDLLGNYYKLKEENAIGLIRAARLYQTALWISEHQPELSWIMFVSAIETVAQKWRKDSIEPVSKLKIFKPNLEKLLFKEGGADLVKKVAIEISDYMGSTKTFIDFILEYFPTEPKNRTEKYSRINWTKRSFNKYLRQIYNYRSLALHGGTPFPSPMCEPPINFKGKYSETPLGLATSSNNAVWVKKDLPMLLHVFEYVVRNSIKNWWRSLYKNA